MISHMRNEEANRQKDKFISKSLNLDNANPVESLLLIKTGLKIITTTLLKTILLKRRDITRLMVGKSKEKVDMLCL